MIETALLIGLAAAGLCFVVWKVVGDTFNKPELLLVPPLGCPLCSSWWASIALCGYSIWSGKLAVLESPPVLLGAVGVCMLVLSAKRRADDA